MPHTSEMGGDGRIPTANDAMAAAVMMMVEAETDNRIGSVCGLDLDSAQDAGMAEWCLLEHLLRRCGSRYRYCQMQIDQC